MNNEKTPRKEIIKNIAIVFLAVLLVLTFFSNTIMNYSLPQVSAVYVNQGIISEQIRGSGTVTAAESYEVKFEETREVESVAVKAGQTVAAGDVLFKLADEDSAELTEAQNTLASLELEYKKAELSLAASTGFETDYLTISRAEEELSKLKEQLAAAESGDDPLQTATEKYKEAKSLSEKLTREKESLNAALASVDTEDMLDLTGEHYDALRAAKDKVTEAEKKAEKAKKTYDDLVSEIGDSTDYKEAIKSKQDEIETARNLLNEYYVSYFNLKPDEDSTSMSLQISSQKVTISKLERELSELMVKASSSSVKKTKLETAEASMNKAQDKVTEAKDELSLLTREVKLEIKAELDKLNEKLIAASDAMAIAEEEKSEAEALGLLSVSQLTAKITEKSDEIAKLKADLSVKQSTSNVETQTAQLDLEAKADAIEQQKKKVEKLKSKSYDAVVKAKMGGTVESVSVTSGSKVEAGTTAAVINVSDMGYEVEFSVKTEQAKKVKVGDKAEITSWYWGDNFSATLSEIRPDTANPQSHKILVFTVSGSDISTGQTITLSMGSKGQTYSAVVPNSAVREDSNGKFVLVMEAKSSPLGNRYKAVRYDVNVIVKDDNNSAVEGLQGSEFVIITSTKPISAGEQVRPAE
ncbi:MAG: HlyD family efflux transporter periplasmic adaptor subunit [Oscillospiraceae bacterium]|nr:HlyD family efflux transporter periplasmic adaptor subunit [Oscillospiraceae bacterium]